jgi:hypothetical protein
MILKRRKNLIDLIAPIIHKINLNIFLATIRFLPLNQSQIWFMKSAPTYVLLLLLHKVGNGKRKGKKCWQILALLNFKMLLNEGPRFMANKETEGR